MKLKNKVIKAIKDYSGVDISHLIVGETRTKLVLDFYRCARYEDLDKTKLSVKSALARLETIEGSGVGLNRDMIDNTLVIYFKDLQG